jgi:hypothetical protein
VDAEIAREVSDRGQTARPAASPFRAIRCAHGGRDLQVDRTSVGLLASIPFDQHESKRRWPADSLSIDNILE